jgi:enoyl-[acyl-carrier protein] reductase II
MSGSHRWENWLQNSTNSMDNAIMKTRLTELLGIEHPIIQAGMSWASSSAELPSAVSNAGGLGVLAAGPMYIENFEAEVKKIKSMTDRPFAVNVPLYSEKCPAFLDIAHRLKVPVIIASQGGPKPHLPRFKASGVTWIQVVAGLEHARKAQAAGVDALVVVGCEAGGHPPQEGVSTLVNVRHVLSHVNLPVVAAGGAADGWAIASLLALGADAVQLGTRFLMTREASIHPSYQEAVLRCEVSGTDLVGLDQPVRVIKNSFSEKMLQLQHLPSCSDEAREFFKSTTLKQAALLGDVMWGKVEAGESAGLIHDVLSVEQLMQQLLSQMQAAFERMKEMNHGN